VLATSHVFGNFLLEERGESYYTMTNASWFYHEMEDNYPILFLLKPGMMVCSGSAHLQLHYMICVETFWDVDKYFWID
jgi:hypothetical protein